MTASHAAGAPPLRHNLPTELASFVGRQREIAEVKAFLQRTRLLTLTGAGGCGKTRLALRVAADCLPSFADGVWLVQLAPVTDSALVPRAVASAVGVRGGSGQPLLRTLATALAPRRLLLLIDNCEHLIGACAQLAETLLRACPQLQILATSREPLRIAGEVIWRVPSLGLPGTGFRSSPESLAQVEAVALFLDRARARQPDFTLTVQNAGAVATICRRLEGMPLGIELAAAQMGALSADQIAAGLDDALRVLIGGSRTLARQETLRATLDWSHALLEESEHVLFRRLSVFAGGFGVEAMECVCSGEGLEPGAALSALTTLVEKSLVEPQIRERPARYRLLEPVRQYARARLTAHGEVEALQCRHAEYFLALAEAAEPELMSGQRAAALERLARERDNLRAALLWSRHTQEPDAQVVGLRLVGALAWFWGIQGDGAEGLEWTEAALAKSTGAPPAPLAQALHMAGELAWQQGQYAVARTRLEESAELFRTLGDKRGLAYVLQILPMVIEEPEASAMGAEALRLFKEAGDAWGAAHAAFTLSYLTLLRDESVGEEALKAMLVRCRALGDEWMMAEVLNYLGDLARGHGDIQQATARYEESLALLRKQGLTGTVPSLLHNLGYMALQAGNTRRALRLFRESLILFRDLGDQRGIAECLAGLAGALAAMRLPDRAARLFGAGEALMEAAGASMWRANLADYERNRGVARGQMDDAAFAAAWETGRALTAEQAIAEAVKPEPATQSLGDTDELDLTPREREVAALLARGLTNRQIGIALVITEGTARLHVKHILQKLGFSSRAQVAAWAVERGLAAAPEPR